MHVEVRLRRNAIGTGNRAPRLPLLHRRPQENAVVPQIFDLAVHSPVECDHTARVLATLPLRRGVSNGRRRWRGRLLLGAQRGVSVPQEGPVRGRQVRIYDNDVGLLQLAALKADAGSPAAFHQNLVHWRVREQLDTVLPSQLFQRGRDALPPTNWIPNAVGEVGAGKQAKRSWRIVRCKADVQRLEGEKGAQPLVLKERLHQVVDREQHVHERQGEPTFEQHLRDETDGIDQLSPAFELPVDEALHAHV
mmetsp:Transcript_42831/g.118387  ORF Transcript_42831/g.118387 Transcript_42831/m.118387 type:complete len:250 (-) Transcript_42831:789-1538(-)